MIKLTDFLNYRSLSELTANPGGSRLAFDLMQADLAGNRYTRELWIYVNGEIRRLLSDDTYKGNFIWLDDNRGAFISDKENDRTRISTLDTVSGLLDETKSWSLPAAVNSLYYLGGSIYAYTATEVLNGMRHPEELAFLDDMPGAYEIAEEIPLWSNGRGFISGRRNRAFLYNRDSGASRPLLAAETDVDTMKVQAGALYIQARTYRGMNTEPGIYRVDSAGNTTTLVEEGNYRIVDFSPKGGTVYFAAQNKWETCMTDDPSFYAANKGAVEPLPIPDCSVGSQLGSDCMYGVTETFSAGEDDLYFVYTGETSTFLVRANPGTGEVERLTGEGGTIDSFIKTANGIYVVAMRGQELQELYRLRNGSCVENFDDTNCGAKNHELERLTSFNLEVATSVKPEMFTFRNHGFNVNYVVIPPAGFDSSTTYPAILYIHGGAKVIYSDIFFHEMQFLSSRGYYVIYGNPHGSDGQGSEFAKLLGEYGQKDYDDLMKAMDSALELYPNIDKERLGIAGGSYGGIMTNWCIGHTDRFKAAVAQRSICNMVSAFGTADNGYNFVKEQMDGDLWNGLEKLWGQSPLKYADKVTTPLLLVHSREDYRCHYTEAIQMFTALKYHGVESRICLIAGENHNLSRSGRPKQRIKRLYEIASWFDKYLL